MFHTIYKITNTINQKFYIGAHSTKNPNDSYMGSGKNIAKAIKKYGKENFTKEILYTLPSKEEMFLKEQEIVDIEFLLNPMVYNIALGGYKSGKHFEKGKVMVIFENGQRGFISNKDERFVTGKLKQVGSLEGTIRVVEQETGNSKFIDKNLLEYFEQNGWVVWSTGYNRYKDDNGNQFYLRTNDPKIKELKLNVWTKGKLTVSDKQGNIIFINSKDYDKEIYTHILKNMVSAKDINGNTMQVSINDPRYISGELVGVNKGKVGLANHLNSIKYNCKHCNFETTRGNLERWHNDNCKHR